MNTTDEHPDISIVLPCLDEKEALPLCVAEIRRSLKGAGLNGEIIIVDNGSTDGSLAEARALKEKMPELILLTEDRRGYGAACLAGMRISRGKYIFLADADRSYDFTDIPRFIAVLDAGADLVVGNRFAGTMEKGAMPWHHRYIGNPVLSFFVKKSFGVKIGDIHCGARAIKRNFFESLTLYTRGMEFASELIIKAQKSGGRIAEIPVPYHRRVGTSKLRSVGDGWRHLRFILIYSPLYLFLIPGLTIAAIGIVSMCILYFGNISLFGLELYVHPMFVSALFIMVGYQIIFFAGFSKIYAMTHLGETDAAFDALFRKITIEKVGLAGIIVCGLGALLYGIIFARWIHSGFGSLDEIKTSIVALTFGVLGIQTFFSAFMLSTLGIQEK